MIDYGHRETDLLLEDLEKKVSRVYAEAVSDVQDKLDDYLRRFEVKDETWRGWVASGKKTAEEYKAWRTSQLMMGQRWEDMRAVLAEDMHNANVISRSIITGYMPEAYAINHNFATYEIERLGRVDTSYTLYSRETVERILRDEPDLLPMPGARMNQTFTDFDAYKAGKQVDLTPKQKKAFDKLIAEGKDIRWQEGQIQSVMTQSILQGESIPNIAKRIARTMGETNHASTIRYARTAITGAQNAGREDAYKRAEDMGIKIKRMWDAVLDGRTRHEHRQLDGQVAAIGEPFEVDGYEIMFPGDPAAEGFLIWNCRCKTRSVIDGLEPRAYNMRSTEAIGMSYEEWKEGHGTSDPITKQEDIAAAMKRRYIREYRDGS